MGINETWQYVLLLVGSPVVAAVVTWLLTRAKTRSETKRNLSDSRKSEADISLELVDRLAAQVDRLSKNNDRLEAMYEVKKNS